MAARSQIYMPHIAGLRCFAVMAVLLFHFGVPGMGGGYVGVDVFFVISGYLITNGIVEEIARTGSFSFGHFYSRRIRRIIPALIATLAVTTILAIASLTPADLVAYGKSLMASSISLSNLLFWSQSGYFDAASQTKPLLHTWSLSVEEQFYMFWPAIIYLAYRLFSRRGLVWSIVAAGLLSFIANHFVVAAHNVGYKSDLFFLPQFRVFEFAIGAMGCFVAKKLPSSRWLHELLMALGLALIAYSIAWLREGMVFPYVKAIAPCLGALLVILAHRSTSAGAVLTNKTATWIGAISYSLYLTHWPILVFVDQYLPVAAWGIKFSVMALFSLVTAAALHYWVEVRYRYSPSSPVRGNVIGPIIASAIAMSVLGAAVFDSNGMIWRYNYFMPGSFGGSMAGGALAPPLKKSDPAAVTDETLKTQAQPVFRPLSATEIEAGKNRRFADLATACNIQVLQDARRCFMDRPVQVLFFGNSHEPDAFNAFNHLYGKDPRVNLINFGTVNDCVRVLTPGSISSPTQNLACDKRFGTLNDEKFLRHVNVLVYNVHQGFDEVARDLWGILELLKKKNPSIRIIAIGSYMQTKMDCSSLYNKYGTYDACKREEFVESFDPDERSLSPIPQVKTLDYIYISKYELFCKRGKLATCTIYANGEPAFYDQDHLSIGFARYMGDRILETHRADLKAVGLPVPDGTGLKLSGTDPPAQTKKLPFKPVRSAN
jgi:peptidoglycan/LPS O-acetylase OafA/YrhL